MQYDNGNLIDYDDDVLRPWVVLNSLHFTRYFFGETTKKRFIVSEHHRQVCNALDKVLKGEITKLIINIAPRYGKTELVVKHFIAKGLATNPAANFIHLSYSASLATDNSEAIKTIINCDAYKRLFNTRIKYGSDTKNKWRTEQGGGVYATSTLGQITGFGAGLVDSTANEIDLDDLRTPEEIAAEQATEQSAEQQPQIETIEDAIDTIQTGEMDENGAYLFGGAIVIDDPIKPEDALSDVVRERVNRRFETTIRNRVNSRKTPIIIIMQRLHEHDLCGYLHEIEPDEWTTLSLPCIIEDKDGNPQPLWPFKHTMRELDKIRQANSFVFETQYMQNPKPLEGLMYEHFKTYDAMPIESEPPTKKCYIDTADTGQDYLCAIFYDEYKSGCFVTDILFTDKPMEYTEVETPRRLIKNGTQEVIVESNNGGRGFARKVEENVRNMGDWKMQFATFTQTANKAVRIFSHSAEVQNMVHFPTPWATLWPSYHQAMTSYRKIGNNAHDDAPDATTGVVEYFQNGLELSLSEEENSEIEESIY